MQVRRNSKPLLFFTISILLGILSSSKIPESDLLLYNEIYDKSASHNIIDYVVRNMTLYGIEPLYSLSNYFVLKFLRIEFSKFLFLFTFFIYFLLGKSLIKISRDNTSLIIAMCLIFYSENFFSLSTHLLRQFISITLAIYLNIKGKHISSILLAASMHLLGGFVGITLFILSQYDPERTGKFKLTRIFWVLIGILLVTMSISSFMDITVLSKKLKIAGRQDLEVLSLAQYVYIFMSLSLLLFRRLKGQNFNKYCYSLFLFCVVPIFLSQYTEIAQRIFFLNYFFLPLVVATTNMKIILKSRELAFLQLFALTYFLLSVKYFSIWTYEILW